MAKPNPLQALQSEIAKSMESQPGQVTAVPVPLTPKPAPAPAVTTEPAPAPEAPATRPTGSKSSREGKRFLGYYVEPRRHEEIKEAAADQGILVQELMLRAIDAWMEEHGQEGVQIVARRHARRSKQAN